MAARTAWCGGRSVLQIKGFLLGRGRWELSRPSVHLPLVVVVVVCVWHFPVWHTGTNHFLRFMS